MKILVTGSAGFIGSALSIKLLDRGDILVGIDNHNDYYDPKLKEARLARHINHPNYTHIRMNIEDRQAMADLFEHEGFDSVVNLAAQAGVRYSLENPLALLDCYCQCYKHDKVRLRLLDQDDNYPIQDLPAQGGLGHE